MTEDPKGLLFGALPSSDEASPAPAKTEGEAWVEAAANALHKAPKHSIRRNKALTGNQWQVFVITESAPLVVGAGLPDAASAEREAGRLDQEASARAAIHAADLARFGGDPGEMLDAGHEWMRRAWYELNAIRARDGAPQGVSEEYWSELTDGLSKLLGDNTVPWMTEAAKLLLAPQIVRIAELEAQIAQLEREGSELSADQCHHGYAGEHGHHMCKYQDRIAELETQIAAKDAALEPFAELAGAYDGKYGMSLVISADDFSHMTKEQLRKLSRDTLFVDNLRDARAALQPKETKEP